MRLGIVHPAVAAEAGVIGVEHDAVAARRSLKLVVAEGAGGVKIECEDQTGALEDQHFVVVVLPQLMRCRRGQEFFFFGQGVIMGTSMKICFTDKNICVTE
jgi:hypothetical protein